MYLSKLEIQGFKSFASGTSLEFQRGITAIVGPNGSGKSNVADAIRWVLGEQSLKLLRGKKSDDVIFAGSDKKARLGVAEVSLYLNNEDQSAAIDYSELVISRRVYRDGEGEYLINHQPARLQDIQLLLAQANFGQRTYSVIGQGMIDSFLLSSPQERKHLFDEAAGVRQYQLKKEQALSKLLQSKDNLSQGEAIMQEIEPRLRSLTRQVKRLERREEVEKELRTQQTKYFALRWQDMQRELEQSQAARNDAEGRRSVIADELDVTQHELEKIEQERSASEQFAILQKKYNAIIDIKNELLEQQAVVKGKLELAAGQAGAGEVAYLQKRAQELDRQIKGLDEDRVTLAASIGQHRKKLEAEQKALRAADDTFTELEQRLTKIQAAWQEQVTLPEAHQAIKEFFDKYEALVAELHGSEALDVPSIQKRAKALQQELSSIMKRLASASGDTDPQTLTDLQQSLVEQSKQRQEILKRVNELATQVQLSEAKDIQLGEQAERLTSELTKLKKEVSTQELAKSDPEAAYAAYVSDAKQIEQRLAEVDEQLKTARTEINSFNTDESSKKERLFGLQKEFRNTQHHLNVATNQVNELQVALARLEQRQEDLRREIEQAMGENSVDLVIAASQEKLDGDVALLAEEIGHLRHQLELIGGIDEQVTNEYQETNERWEFLSKQAEDLQTGITQLESAIGELDEIIKKRFDAAFKKINEEFNTYFRTLFRGGRAELVLIKEVVREKAAVDEDEDDDEEAEELPVDKNAEKVITGIDIKATPPGKKLGSVAMLSGGERALTSIALLCAIIANNPSPFVALDEVDAALDEANSQRFAAILEQLAHKTQFITITHNRATMEKASIMYGVTMGDDGASQLLSVKMDQVEDIIQSYGNR